MLIFGKQREYMFYMDRGDYTVESQVFLAGVHCRILTVEVDHLLADCSFGLSPVQGGVLVLSELVYDRLDA